LGLATSLQHWQREKKMHEVPTVFPTLAQFRTVNSRPFNDFFFALLPTCVFGIRPRREVLGIKGFAESDLLPAEFSQVK
jgi:hypothetical protein